MHASAAPRPIEPVPADGQRILDGLNADTHLSVIAGPGLGLTFPLGREPISVGRGRADIDLGDAGVSRHHAWVRHRAGRIEIRDGGSTNGTMIRRGGVVGRLRGWIDVGTRWQDLTTGSLIQVGQSILEVRARPGSLRAPEPLEKPRRGRAWRLAARIVPALLMPLLLLPLLLLAGSGWWRLGFIIIPLTMIGTLLASERTGSTKPAADAATVQLLSASGVTTTSPGARLILRVSASPGRARRPRWITVSDGAAVGVWGEGAAGVARWLTGQILTWQRDAEATVPPAWGQVRPGLSTSGSSPSHQDQPWHVTVLGRGPLRRPVPVAGKQNITVVYGPDPGELPAWITHRVRATAGVGRRWFREVAGAAPETAGSLPELVEFEEIVGPITARTISRRWTARTPGLSAPIGLWTPPGQDVAPTSLDLVGDGPHALLAGVTGAGKSEALTTWLVALALNYSPEALQLVIIDYKGGAMGAHLAGLPHVAGVLTDLEPASTGRALASLTAELQRRERLLAAAGASDIDTLLQAGGTLARLVVVVDEFRALAEEHPEVLDRVVRLAAQGRSLGLHVILSTQRPAGSINAEISSNIGLRICLRVLSESDSRDMVGTTQAALIPPIPGRALLSTTETPVQFAYCDSKTAARAVTACQATWGPQTAVQRPWAPALPQRITAGQTLPGTEVTITGHSVAVIDLPFEQRLGVWQWTTAVAAVFGRAGSGRSHTLRTLGHTHHGWVHVLGPATIAEGLSRVGTLIGDRDPRRTVRLLEALHNCPDPTGQLLIIDDADALVDLIDDVSGPGQGTVELAAMVRAFQSRGIRIALGAHPTSVHTKWGELTRTRVDLSTTGTDATAIGTPKELWGQAPLPGRGVIIDTGGAWAGHIITPAATALDRPGASPDETPDWVPVVQPLPERVVLTDLTVTASGRERSAAAIPIGIGGDGAKRVTITIRRSGATVVLGPPGSGRTTALRSFAEAAGKLGLAVHGIAGGDPIDFPPGAVVIVDDIEAAPQAWLDDLERARHSGVVVVVATTITAAQGAYRGPLATWRERSAILLRPDIAAGRRLFSVDLSTRADPAAVRIPGRAVLIEGRTATAVQLAQPSASAPVSSGGL